MLQCNNIQARYAKQGQNILDGVDFSAKAYEFIAIIGQNGSGKSTFLQSISGDLPIYDGEIFLQNKLLQDFSFKKRAKNVAVVPQRLDNVPSMLVEQMVLLGRYAYLPWWGAYGADDYAVAADVLREVGAYDLRLRSLDTLSGGELQRVLLARALAQCAPLLLLDELSAGLDMARMAEVFTVLEQRRRLGFCIVTVMHDVNLAALYATRLVGLKKGKILFDGPVHDVFTVENLELLYESRVHIVQHPAFHVPQACPHKISDDV